MLLAIDTSTRYAGVALSDEDRLLSCRSWYSSTNHTAQLMPAVSELLNSYRLTSRDLSGIAIALVVLSANFMGDSLRDRLDPALRRST